MKGIGLILFSIAMFVFGIFSAVMLFQSDWYFWVATLLIALIAGIITAILGLILVCRQDSSRKNPRTGCSRPALAGRAEEITIFSERLCLHGKGFFF